MHKVAQYHAKYQRTACTVTIRDLKFGGYISFVYGLGVNLISEMYPIKGCSEVLKFYRELYANEIAVSIPLS